MNDDLKKLFAHGRTKKFAAGKIIIYEGDVMDKIFYLSSGFVKVYTYVGQSSQRLVFIYLAGEAFPLTTYLSSDNMARFIYESMTAVKLCVLSSRKFQKQVKGKLDIGEEIVQYTRGIDGQFLERVHSLISTEEPLSKIVETLQFLIGRAGSGSEQLKIDVPLSTKVLASLCSLDNEETAKQMDYLISKGVIVKAQNLVINRTKLDAMTK